LIQNGYELNELHGVLISSEANNDLLVYESSSTLWKNKSISTIFGGTPLVSVPTLAQVTTAGNTTTNAITVGGLTISNGSASITKTTSGATLTLTPNASDNAIVINNNGYIKFTSSTDSFIRGSSSTFNILDASYVSKVNFHWGGSASWINTGGNLLIGTTTDAGYKLDVNGTARLNAASGNDIITDGTNVTINGYAGSGSVTRFQARNAASVLIYKFVVPNQTDTAARFIGNVGFGINTPVANIHTSGSITAASALAQGVYFNNTLVAAANNDVLVGLDINPTFTNGAFTGVQNVDLRTKNAGVVIGSGYGYGALYGYANDGLVQITTAATYKTQMWFRPSGNALGYNANYWSRIEHDMGTLNILGSSYGQLLIAANNGGGNGGRINFTGSTGAANNSLTIDGAANGGRIALTTAASPITLNGGNVLIGTTTDAGAKVQIKGSGNTSATTSLLVQNSSGTNALKIADDALSFYYGTFGVAQQHFYSHNGSGARRWSVRYSLNVSSTLATPNASAILQADSTTKGFLQPRMLNWQVLAITTPATGLQAYDTTNNKNLLYNGTAWQNIATESWVTGQGYLTSQPWIVSGSNIYYNTGNVGIGTTTPTDIFHIVNNTNGNKFARISAGGSDASAAWVAQNDQVDNVVYRVFGSGVSGSQMGIALARSASLMANLGGSGKFLVGTYSSTDFVMGTGNQERMRLVDSTGNFLIGTTTDLGNKLEVSGTINATAYKINNVIGYTGILNIPTNPPGMQNVDIQSGIVVNIF